jgi:hypothetical protein
MKVIIKSVTIKVSNHTKQSKQTCTSYCQNLYQICSKQLEAFSMLRCKECMWMLCGPLRAECFHFNFYWSLEIPLYMTLKSNFLTFSEMAPCTNHCCTIIS